MRPVLGGGRYSTGDLQSLVLIKGLGQGQGRDRNLESNWTLRNKKLEKINPAHLGHFWTLSLQNQK